MTLGFPSFRAVFGGFVALLFLYALYALGVQALSEAITPTLIAIGGYLVLSLAGFAAGAIAHKNGVINGMIVGVLAPIANVAYMLTTQRNWSHVQHALLAHGLFWIFAGVLFCGLGRLVWDGQRKLVHR